MSNAVAGTSGKIYVYDVEMDLTAVSTADSATWTITDNAGTTSASGTLTYTAALLVEGLTDHPAWYANVTWPDAPGRYHIHMTMTKDSNIQKWHDYVLVDAFAP